MRFGSLIWNNQTALAKAATEHPAQTRRARAGSFRGSLTGITDAMVRRAPPVRQVMDQAVRFAGGHPIVAHNASFDRKFWERETAAIQGCAPSTFLCSLLLARRMFPGAPNHKLATLVRALRLPSDGRFHRALADAECTAHLFIRLQQEIVRVFGVAECDCGLMQQMQAASRHQLDKCVRKYVEGVAG